MDDAKSEVKKISNFFPDFLLVLRKVSTGDTIPAIIEVKGSVNTRDLSKNQDSHLAHKVRAAHDYRVNTDIPFFIVDSQDGISTIIGTPDRDSEGQHAGSNVFQVLKDQLDKGSITEARSGDRSWMRNLGL